jgi:hypothetical protein
LVQALKLSLIMPYAKRIPEAMGAAKSKKDSSEVRFWV